MLVLDYSNSFVMWILNMNFFEFFLSFQFNIPCSHSWTESETSCVHLWWSVLSNSLILWVFDMNDRYMSKHIIQICPFKIKNRSNWILNAHKMQFVTVVFFKGHLLSLGSLHVHVWGGHKLGLIIWACSESSHNSITVHIATKLVCVNLACHFVLFLIVFSHVVY